VTARTAIVTMLLVVVLLACGGGSKDEDGAGGTGATGTTGSAAAGPSGSGGSGGEAPPPLGTTLAIVELTDLGASGMERHDVPVTFGHPFAPRHVPSGATVAARIGDTNVPLQVDAKATHADGSFRHAVLTALLPALPANGSAKMELVATETPLEGAAVAASDVLATTFDAKVSLALGGESYGASARALLQADETEAWLRGPLVTEWTLAAPVTDSNGVPHPHLSARFDVRAYAGEKSIWVSATIENDWAYEPGPQNFTYDATLSTDAGTVYQKSSLTHYAQARWRKVFFWGDDPAVGVKHDVAYLLSTRAVPSFDPTLVPAESALADLDAAFAGPNAEPMAVGLADPSMPDTGGRADIGPMPAWAAVYLLSQDPRAKRVTLGTADAAGTWQIHYRDKKTGRPVSLADYPYMTILGNPSAAAPGAPSPSGARSGSRIWAVERAIAKMRRRVARSSEVSSAGRSSSRRARRSSPRRATCASRSSSRAPSRSRATSRSCPPTRPRSARTACSSSSRTSSRSSRRRRR